MRLSSIRVGVLLMACGPFGAAAASAQPARDQAAARVSPAPQLRSQISIMEGALERAVNEGIRGAINEMPEAFPQAGMWVTPPRARGFRIDGYGAFFDVEIPTLPASIAWAATVMNRQNEIALATELNQLRALAENVTDANKRAEMMRAIGRVQARTTGAALSDAGVPPQQGGQATLVSSGATRTVPPATAPAMPVPMRDPEEVYGNEVKKSLIGVMLNYGTSLQIGPDEWFTVAASQMRGSELDTQTLVLSMQGKDLAAVRAKQISPEEATKRMVIKTY